MLREERDKRLDSGCITKITPSISYRKPSRVLIRTMHVSRGELVLGRTPTRADERLHGVRELFFHEPRESSLDSFWLRDESLEESHNLPDPDVLAQEIVEDLEAAL
jgi:hypothetical protein